MLIALRGASSHRSSARTRPTSRTSTTSSEASRAAHPLGTDELGRDELSRLLWAGRTDLRVGVLAVIFPFCFGTLVGTLAGYYGGGLDCGVIARHRRR